MNHTMLCISGFSGVGKDEFLGRLVRRFGVIQTGLVDPAKRHVADIYGFTESQLFGPSRNRNSGDIRYPKTTNPTDFCVSGELPAESNQWADSPVPWWSYRSAETGDVVWVRQHDPKFWLSPREALQLYCELMNKLYEDTWVRRGIEIHKLIATGMFDYNRMVGLIPRTTMRAGPIITAFADFRHHHEFRSAESIRTNDCRPVFIRIKSKRVPTAPYQHRSETEQMSIPDSKFDFIVENDGSIDELHAKADALYGQIISNVNP